jgi:hypothetical protein
MYTETWYRRHRKYESDSFLHDKDGSFTCLLTGNSTRLEVVKMTQQNLVHNKPKIWDDLNEEEQHFSIFSSLGMFDE